MKDLLIYKCIYQRTAAVINSRWSKSLWLITVFPPVTASCRKQDSAAMPLAAFTSDQSAAARCGLARRRPGESSAPAGTRMWRGRSRVCVIAVRRNTNSMISSPAAPPETIVFGDIKAAASCCENLTQQISCVCFNLLTAATAARSDSTEALAPSARTAFVPFRGSCTATSSGPKSRQICS